MGGMFKLLHLSHALNGYLCVSSMIDKDASKRPSAADALRFPVVLRQIEVNYLHVQCFTITVYSEVK